MEISVQIPCRAVFKAQKLFLRRFRVEKLKKRKPKRQDTGSVVKRTAFTAKILTLIAFLGVSPTLFAKGKRLRVFLYT
jgi:hypothetical protein